MTLITVEVTAEQLKAEELRLRYIELLRDPSVYPTRKNWDYIISNHMPGLGRELYSRYLAAATVDDVDASELHQIALEEFPKYLMAVERDYALEVVYADTTTAPDATATLIEQCGLFDADYLINLINIGELSMAIRLLCVYQPSYTDADVDAMQCLANKIAALPEVGGVEHRVGMFGSSEKYICPNGHANPVDTIYCTHSGCGLDARGLTAAQEKAVDTFMYRLKALHSLFR